jgi:uncharacterized protein (DUF305 family)
MKNFGSHLSNLQVSGLVVGVLAGAIITICAFFYLLPTQSNMIQAFYSKELQNKLKLAGCNMVDQHHIGMTVENGTNPYLMSSVSTEKQYAQEMILQHDATIAMSTQVLAVKNVSPQIKMLATNMISTQGLEMKILKNWLLFAK